MAELRFRRIFQAEMDARGWNMPGVVMKMAESAVPVQPSWPLYLPLLECER